MFDNIVSMVMGMLMAIGLYYCRDVPIEQALTIGFVAIIAYTLGDISRHLRKRSQ